MLSPDGFTTFGPLLDRLPRYEHEVTIQTFGIEFPAIVYFAQDSTFSRNFLRYGWLERPRIGIVDYDRMLFVGPYQS
jgi:hypothetical protein